MRRFFIIWGGQTLSIVGSSLTSFALYVWVYQESGSVTRFALISVFASLTALLVGPYAGVIVDRHDRRRVMLFADTGAAVISALVLALAWTDQLRIWHVYFLVAGATLLLHFHGPSFTAATTVLVPKKQFARTAGLRQMSQAGASVIAPLLGGWMLVRYSLEGVVLVDLATFLFAFATLLAVRVPRPPETEHSAVAGVSWWRQAGKGWLYLRERRPLLRLLAYVATVNFVMGLAIILFTPLVLSYGTAAEVGRVLAMGGLGAFAGGVLMSVTGGPRRRMLGVVAFAFVASVSLVLAGGSQSLFFVGAGAFLAAAGLPLVNGCAQAIWQAKVAPEMQGRVFAFRRLIGQATLPVALLAAGPLADRVFEPLMAPGGALASVLGPWIGVGKGRGIAVIYLILAAIALCIGLWGVSVRSLRSVEEDLPDAVTDEEDAGESPAAAEEGEPEVEPQLS